MEGRAEEAAAAAAGTGGGNPAAALLEALLAVPDLSTLEDREQLAGITSLAAVLQVRRSPIPFCHFDHLCQPLFFSAGNPGNVGSGLGPYACTRTSF